MSRIVLATFGSLGDLHPYLALALELQRRGHTPVLATNGVYREKIAALGLEFHAVRPDVADFGDFGELMKKVADRRRGPEYVMREMIVPHLRASHEDLLAATEGADLLLSHILMYALPLVAEQRRIPWMGVALQPVVLWSAYDRVVPMAELGFLRHLPPALFRLCRAPIRAMLNHWTRPVHQLRAELGLPPRPACVMMEGAFSDVGNLVLLSPVFAPPQPDWPPHAIACGFPIFDDHARDATLASELADFLDAGEPPVVFTLGSSAVFDAGNFFAESAAAARLLGRRAVLLTGGDERNIPPGDLPPDLCLADYAPFSELFPRAAAIVHQCGIGTTAQGLRAGKPVLAMPFSQDQPDNAQRLARLGVARVIDRGRYRADRVARELAALLDDPGYAQRAAAIGTQVRSEEPLRTAGDAIEAVLARR